MVVRRAETVRATQNKKVVEKIKKCVETYFKKSIRCGNLIRPDGFLYGFILLQYRWMNQLLRYRFSKRKKLETLLR